MAGADDFVVIDNGTTAPRRSPMRRADAADLHALCRSVPTAHLIEARRATFQMRYYHRMAVCRRSAETGRCAARFAFLNVIAGRKMTIETDAGT
jgi:hypothetical protein